MRYISNSVLRMTARSNSRLASVKGACILLAAGLANATYGFVDKRTNTSIYDSLAFRSLLYSQQDDTRPVPVGCACLCLRGEPTRVCQSIDEAQSSPRTCATDMVCPEAQPQDPSIFPPAQKLQAPDERAYDCERTIASFGEQAAEEIVVQVCRVSPV